MKPKSKVVRKKQVENRIFRLEYERYLICVESLEIVINLSFLRLKLNFKFDNKEHNGSLFYSTAKSGHLKKIGDIFINVSSHFNVCSLD